VKRKLKSLSTILFKLALDTTNTLQKKEKRKKLPTIRGVYTIHIPHPPNHILSSFVTFLVVFSFFFFVLYPCWILCTPLSHRPHDLKPKTKRPLSFPRSKDGNSWKPFLSVSHHTFENHDLKLDHPFSSLEIK
jgi:hypothetical protein